MINENQDSFGAYGLSDDILESLRLLGYERPTEIQQQVIPAMEALRKPVDELEMIVDKEIWPMPSYGDLLFEV